MRRNRLYALLLIVVLGMIWIATDRLMKREETFNKAYEFSFDTKSTRQIEEFSSRNLGEYRFSQQGDVQIRALVNALECYHFLVYNNAVSVSRFYDFMRIVMLPEQRGRLREKEKYVYEIRRYLRRKRNLKIQYLKFEVSEPIQRKPPPDSRVDVMVIRTDADNRETITYSFQMFKNRYYLFFPERETGWDFTFSDDSI